MNRTMLVVMGALCFSGCAARTLQDETRPVGATCVRTSRGQVTGTYMCPSDMLPERNFAAYEFTSENTLHVSICNAAVNENGLYGSFHFDVREVTLGTHTLPEYTSSIPTPDGDSRNSWLNTGGTVEVEGYDPTTGTVCGTFDISLRRSEGTGTRRETGTFVAILP